MAGTCREAFDTSRNDIRSVSVTARRITSECLSDSEGSALAFRTEVIPLVDLQAAHREVADEISSGFRRIMADGSFVKGLDVAEFEREFALFSGAVYCVGVASGTDAIELSLRAAGVPPGADVIVPANTFAATAAAIVRAGARPVFADVDPDHLLLDPASAARMSSSATAAVVPVHLFGQMAPMKELTDSAAGQGLTIIEDAAQSHGASQNGAPTGGYGRAAAVSFYPGKNLGAYGDAGAVLTNSAALARKVRLLGDHGSEHKYVHADLGFNSRLDSLQAVVLRAKLRRLADWNERRRQAAERYRELLAELDELVLPRTAPGNVHVWHLYVVQVPHRDQVLHELHERGIRAAIHYPVPVHLQPAFRRYGYGPGDFPVAEAAADRIISLPMYPHITASQQRLVADALHAALRAAQRWPTRSKCLH
jgi:dTDP-4-amino-4,6-dideoxygalactose transaminase